MFCLANSKINNLRSGSIFVSHGKIKALLVFLEDDLLTHDPVCRETYVKDEFSHVVTTFLLFMSLFLNTKYTK